jgi:uncharacterized coiled-coil protein SlyX
MAVKKFVTSDTHTVEDCPQVPTLQMFGETLRRLEAHSERQTFALETIAEQGATIKAQGSAITQINHDLNEVFGQVRHLDDRLRHIEIDGSKNLDKRVIELETAHAREQGIDYVYGEKKKFWTAIKIQLAQSVVVGIFIIVWTIDKFNIAQYVAKIIGVAKGVP